MTMRDDIKYCGDHDLGVIGQKLMIPREASEPTKQYRERLLAAVDRREGGGPAFGEFKQVGECSIKTGGLTVRDYFAAKAMQGMLANGDWVTNMTNATGKQADEVVGIAAYEVADAMLRERAK